MRRIALIALLIAAGCHSGGERREPGWRAEVRCYAEHDDGHGNRAGSEIRLSR